MSSTDVEHRDMVVTGRAVAASLAGLGLILAGCTSTTQLGEATGSSSAGSPTTGTVASAAPSSPGAVEGTFDVGGHRLFITCQGTRAPTVVYMHGAISEPGVDPHVNGEPVQRLLSKDYRVCLYDRRNLGHSDTVDAPQRPQDALRDMRQLLRAARIDPPYVLLGASFGGMLSYLYANQHPDEVVAMVLLDAMFPDELSLEHLFEPTERFEAFDEEDETDSLERMSHYKVQQAAQQYIGKEPDIPVVYLASESEGHDDNDYGMPEYDREVLEAQAAYVDRFSPGTLVAVEAPHFMEPVIPDKIAASVREVISQADL